LQRFNTGSFSGNACYEPDCRNINELGFEHAMRCFLANYTEAGSRASQTSVAGISADAWADVVCDQEALARIRV
jgi:hypothetical protein